MPDQCAVAPAPAASGQRRRIVETPADRARCWCPAPPRTAAPPAPWRAVIRSRRARRPCRARARRALHHVEAEHPAFDRAVPHRHAARRLQAHLAGQLQVGRQQPGGPAGVVLLPVGGQLHEELAAVVGMRLFARRQAPRRPRPHASDGAPVRMAGRHRQNRRPRSASPYGGLTSITPGGSHGGMRCKASPPRNSTASATPARSRIALREVDHAVRHVAAEDAWALRPAPAGAGRAWASFEQGVPDMGLERQHLLEGEAAQRSRARCCRRSAPPRWRWCRCRNTGRTAACRGVSVQPLAASIAAASVSFSGASPLSSRQPRLNSASPEVSMYSDTVSVVRWA